MRDSTPPPRVRGRSVLAMLLTCAADTVRGRRAGAVPPLAALLLAALAALGAGQAAAHHGGNPRITTVTVSDPANGDTFVQGETITVTLAFSIVVSDNRSCSATLWPAILLG